MKKTFLGMILLVAASAYAGDLAKVVSRSVDAMGSKALSRALGDAKVVADANATGCEYRAGESEGESNTLACNPSVEKMTDSERAIAVGRALAHATYGEVEGEWLKYLGEREAWVMKNGHAVKMSTGANGGSAKLVPSGAKDLWASFVGREVSRTGETSALESDRQIASANEAEATIRRLLEIQ